MKSIKAEQAEQSKKVQNDLEKITFEDFVVKLIQTFDVGTPEPSCPPYEGVLSEQIKNCHYDGYN
ncbi:MAG: hypothetical protein JETT_1040 [Candidatus Jettenia ecosi]|uniref:Uncharacterized protein n=1 Tax=Candidatus Jettenia ecosi TaxID=2494326 RepID=A0A533QD72_9BACT|nr:MAG: hypothetical protein JETT_1040 [Candidatus Jettenia ecosi]